LEEARDALRTAAEIDDFPTAWLDVAQVERDLGNDGAAREALGQAMRIGFQNPQVAFGAMAIYEALGDRDAAVSAAADALAVAPSLAGDPLWTSTPAMGEVLAAAMPIATERGSPEVGYRLALETDNLQEAAEQVAELPDSSRAIAELVVAAWSGDAAAFEQLHARAVANPLDTGVVAICNRLAAISRDPDWEGSGEWTCDHTPEGSEPVIRVTESPPNARVALPGPDATWHHMYVHRRLTPNDELVPGLPRLEAQ
jgi:hypothetical protein